MLLRKDNREPHVDLISPNNYKHAANVPQLITITNKIACFFATLNAPQRHASSLFTPIAKNSTPRPTAEYAPLGPMQSTVCAATLGYLGALACDCESARMNI